VGLIVSFGFFGVVFFLSLFMQRCRATHRQGRAFLQLPCTIGVVVAAILSGRVVGRVGARAPIAVGLTMIGAALLLMTTIGATTPYSQWWFLLLIMGVGNGLVMSPMTSAIMSTVPAARAGMASATSNTMRQVGSVFGIALLGTLVTDRFTAQLRTGLAHMHLPAAVSAHVMAIAGQGVETAAPTAPPGVDLAAIQHVVGVSFTSGIHLALWVCGFLLLAGVPVALTTLRGTAPHHEARA